MASKRKANSTDEIEITPAMMRAGIDEYALFEFADPGEWVVSAIYRAMREVALAEIGSSDTRRDLSSVPQ
jgi:hypothetical protein